MLQQEAAMLTEVESLQKNSSQTMAQGDHVLVKLLLIADVHLPKEEPTKRISSFKKRVAPEESEAAEPPPGRLDNIEERFHWFRQEVLQKVIQDKFADVFPVSWQIEATLARLFLKSTRSHLIALLDPNGQCRDKEASNAPVLLKALQKTLVFEREITGWLERERGAVFKTAEESKLADKTAVIAGLF